MSPLADLPPDQRAVLQLVLKQGRSYDQLAGLLGIDRAAVAERAQAGAEALAPDAARRLSPERRGQVADYILGQHDPDEHEATRAHLAASASARAYARLLSDVLAGEAKNQLPDVPEAAPKPDPEPLAEIDAAPIAREPAAAVPTERRRPPASPVEARVSRVGGALFLAGVAIAAAVIIILLINNSGDSAGTPVTTTPSTARTTSTPATATPTTTTPTTTPTARRTALFELRPIGKSKALGGAQVVAAGTARELDVVAKNMRANTANDLYAVWFYNSQQDAFFCGFAEKLVTGNGQFGVKIPQQFLPSNPRHYKTLVVSLEPRPKDNKQPTRPTDIVMTGVLKGF